MSRYHAFPDLVVINAAVEKQMLDAVDGQRSIASIVDRSGGDRLLPRARRLVERLYSYDQVVVDASSRHGASM